MSENGSIVLFLGAGASACESFPTVLHFFEQVEFPSGAQARGYEKSCMELARLISIMEGTSEHSMWPIFDAEKLWGHLELLVNSSRLMNSPHFLAGFTHSFEELLTFLKQEIIRIYGRSIAAAQTEARSHRNLLTLLDKMIPRDQPLSIYTTNYDTVIEDSMRSPSLLPKDFGTDARLCTGFTEGNPGRWNPQLFDARSSSGTRQVHLFKLHGSIIWKWDRTSAHPEPVEMNWRHGAGDKDCLLYFGYKSVPETDPFRTLHNKFKDSLVRASTVVVIGFQFADPYIRETFDFALRANQELRLICCLKQMPSPNTPLANLMHTFADRVQILTGVDDKPIAFGEDRFPHALTAALLASG